MPSRNVILGLAVVVAGLTASGASAAIPISFRAGQANSFHPTGYLNSTAGVQDATLWYYSPASTDLRSPNRPMRSSSGGQPLLSMAEGGGGTQRHIMKFNLGAMTGQNVVVTSNATLRLAVYQTSTAPTAPTLDNVNLWMYQIAKENNGWVAGTRTASGFTNPTAANQLTLAYADNGAATFYYKAVNTAAPNNGTTDIAGDTTSTKWFSAASGNLALTTGAVGSSPSGIGTTGGLWNQWDIVDQNPATPVNSYADMDGALGENMDAIDHKLAVDHIDTVGTINVGYVDLTIPAAMIQSWIDNPNDNAGLLFRSFQSGTARVYSSEIGSDANGVARPTLNFDYVVPEPTSLATLALGSMLLRRRR